MNPTPLFVKKRINLQISSKIFFLVKIKFKKKCFKNKKIITQDGVNTYKIIFSKQKI